MKHKNIGDTEGKILSAFIEKGRKCFSIVHYKIVISQKKLKYRNER